MASRPAAPVSRRQFLLGGSAVAGAVLLGGCGDEEPAACGTDAGEASGTGDLVLAQFFGGPMLAAGRELRAPFGVADAEGLLPADRTPKELIVSVLDAEGGCVVAPTAVARHDQGLPHAYYPLRFAPDGPGIYTGRTELDGEAVEMAIKVDRAGDVSAIQPGAAMPPVVTPTTDDSQDVDPICTSDPMCPLHDVTVSDALEEARPFGLLVSTPAFCQIAICGPVLEVLLGVVPDHPNVRFLHAEVYAHPRQDLDVKTAIVDELGLTFEPCLVLVRSDGTVADRIDTIFDEVELRDAVARLD
jgi:TAT (twin-arginine translocation) pathway signal sequence